MASRSPLSGCHRHRPSLCAQRTPGLLSMPFAHTSTLYQGPGKFLCLSLSSVACCFQVFCLYVLHAKLPNPRRGVVISHGGKKASQSTSGREGSCSIIQHNSLSKDHSVASGCVTERNPERSLDHQRLLLFTHRSPLWKREVGDRKRDGLEPKQSIKIITSLFLISFSPKGMLARQSCPAHKWGKRKLVGKSCGSN